MSAPTPSDPVEPGTAADDVALVRDINADGDDMLTSLVAGVNGGGGVIDIGVTVAAGGLLITGQLVAGRVWFDGVADSVRTSVAPEDPSAVLTTVFADMYADKANTYPRNLTDPARGEDDETGGYDRIGFLHLRDAVTIAPGGGSLQLGWWRVRLSDISGWTQGKFEW